MRIFLFGWLLAGALGCNWAQAPALPSFDAASLKPSPPIATGPNRSAFFGMKQDAGRITFSNVPMKNLVRSAYSIDTNSKIEGGPGWIDTETFDAVATYPEGTPEDQRMLMLRKLLQERCQLAVHRDTRDQPLYAFVVAKDGLRMKSYDEAKKGNGNRSGKGHLELHNVTLTQLGNFLYGELGRFVNDPKGDGPSLMTAVQEQLGLRLEARRGPVEYLVIDHIEKPSDN